MSARRCLRSSAVASRVIAAAAREIFPFKPAELISHLRLKRPVFRPTAAYGHFGRTGESFTWEKTDKVDDLRNMLL